MLSSGAASLSRVCGNGKGVRGRSVERHGNAQPRGRRGPRAPARALIMPPEEPTGTDVYAQWAAQVEALNEVETYECTLTMPMGIVFEDLAGRCVVGGLVEGGNAAALEDPRIGRGDVLLAASAGSRGLCICEGLDFDSILDALAENDGSARLVFEKALKFKAAGNSAPPKKSGVWGW